MSEPGQKKSKSARSKAVILRALLGVGFVGGLTSLGGLVLEMAQRQPLTADQLQNALKAPAPALKHEWRLIHDKHWQIVSSPSETQEATDKSENTRGNCPTGMVQVKGNMKQDPSSNPFSSQTIEELQKTTCTKWIQREYPERCAEFDRTKWLAISKDFATKPLQFCMDRFEYPNQKGEYPWIAVSWYEATDLCAAEGKRLCDEHEWTFACEGEEATPYPYGYTRDAGACISDQTWRAFNEAAMRPRDSMNAMAEYDRLWQGLQSGSQPKCKSPFGVYDMTGNVDEWTKSAREGERPSILKGGYWGPVRTRCRPSTRSHDENHVFYQQGFRCCSDIGATLVKHEQEVAPASVPLPREAR